MPSGALVVRAQVLCAVCCMLRGVRVAQELSAGFNLFEDDRNGTVAFEDFELVHTRTPSTHDFVTRQAFWAWPFQCCWRWARVPS